MWSWVTKRFGITPELIQQAQESEKALKEQARNLPYEVNRQVMVLLPLAKYFHWQSQWQAKKTPIATSARKRNNGPMLAPT